MMRNVAIGAVLGFGVMVLVLSMSGGDAPPPQAPEPAPPPAAPTPPPAALPEPAPTAPPAAASAAEPAPVAPAPAAVALPAPAAPQPPQLEPELDEEPPDSQEPAQVLRPLNVAPVAPITKVEGGPVRMRHELEGARRMMPAMMLGDAGP